MDLDVEFDSDRFIKACADRGFNEVRLAAALRIREATVLSWFHPDPKKRRAPEGVNVLKVQVLLGLEARDLLKPKEVVAASA